MFRHSDLYEMACFTFATAMFSASRSEAVLNPTGLMFKMYCDHFGTIPVEITGNSPQPKPTDPHGGEQPAISAGSDTFPLDVAAALSSDHKVLSIAVINTIDTHQTLDLRLSNISTSGKGTPWRLARKSLLASRHVGVKSEVEAESSPIASMPTSVLLPKFSIRIYEIQIR